MFNDGLYEVTNFTDDVLAEDHNSVVQAIRTSNSSFGGSINYGDGRDGHLKLGVISESAPTPTASPAGSGAVTGSFYYKVSIYNLSGETTPSTASAVVNPSSQAVRIDIPALATNTNITGFYIYRSDDDVTYYRVGKLAVDDPTSSENYFIDNLPSLNNYSSNQPSVSNSTSNTANIGSSEQNVFFCKTFTIESGQSVQKSDSILLISCSDSASILGDISCQYSATAISNGIPYRDASLAIDPPTSSTTLSPLNSNGIFTSDSFVDGVLGGKRAHSISFNSYPTIINIFNVMDGLGRQGFGGIQTLGSAINSVGGDVAVFAKNGIKISSANINCSAFSVIISSVAAGNAGGNIILKSDVFIDIENSTLSVSGTDGGNPSTTNMIGHGGGGGGLIYIDAPVISDSGNTFDVSGGSHGANNGSGTIIGASGGGNMGLGGYNSATSFSGLSRNGEDGAVVKVTNNNNNLRF